MLNETDRLRILDYVCGRLAPEARARLESELVHNDELRRELLQHQKADGWLAALPGRPARSDADLERFVRRVVHAAQAESAHGVAVQDATVASTATPTARVLEAAAARGRRPSRSRMAWLAAAALVVGAGLYGTYQVFAPPPGPIGANPPPLSDERVLAILADPEIEASFDLIERLSLLTDEEIAESLEVDDSDWFLLETLEALSGA